MNISFSTMKFFINQLILDISSPIHSICTSELRLKYYTGINNETIEQLAHAHLHVHVYMNCHSFAILISMCQSNYVNAYLIFSIFKYKLSTTKG